MRRSALHGLAFGPDVTFEDALNIYTDGSCLSNPRRGGIGIRYIVINAAGDEEWIDECPAGYKQATNNEMELMAASWRSAKYRPSY